MDFPLLGSINVSCKIGDLIDAVDVWCVKPHVVNRRLAGCVELWKEEVSINNIQEDLVADITRHISESIELVKPSNIDNIQSGKHLAETLSENNASGLLNLASLQSDIFKYLNSCIRFLSTGNVVKLKILFRRLLPRHIGRHFATYEVIVLTCTDSAVASISFMPICTTRSLELLCHKTYCIQFNARNLRLEYYTHNDFNDDTSQSALVVSTSWLEETLITKLKTWAESSFSSDTPLRKGQSLALVNIEEYTHLYAELKQKYGPYFIQIWPESTDPLKFVYEDIALATYLLILWKQERMEKNISTMQSFVDLGCGNGLLVHLLSQEGHPGRGIDISKRKIWSLYGDATTLQEEAIQPNALTVKEDWIIGNHSDELTPWIPVIASRSSYSTRYFVLPCCFFDFHTKFHRVDQRKPQYESYLDYIFHIGLDLGFTVSTDTLRIPSTKRVCQIGYGRTYVQKDYDNIGTIISKVLSSRSHAINACDGNDKELFKPRIVLNDPKNCSHVDFEVKALIINTVFENLLLKESEIKEKYESTKISSKGVSWKDWKNGGCIHLNELANLFDSSTLKELKSQCGGLQTLLKNNRHIFKVVGGVVCLRDYRNPTDMKPSKKSLQKSQNKKDKHKTKCCWFYTHHPQGCVLSTIECKYAHGEADCVR